MSAIIYIAPIIAVGALVYAMIRAGWVRDQDPGEERMQTIGGWIADGAMAFLSREYSTLAIFVVVVAILLGYSNHVIGSDQNTNAWIAVSFVVARWYQSMGL